MSNKKGNYSIYLRDRIIEMIDAERGIYSRSACIETCLWKYFKSKKTEE